MKKLPRIQILSVVMLLLASPTFVMAESANTQASCNQAFMGLDDACRLGGGSPGVYYGFVNSLVKYKCDRFKAKVSVPGSCSFKGEPMNFADPEAQAHICEIALSGCQRQYKMVPTKAEACAKPIGNPLPDDDTFVTVGSAPGAKNCQAFLASTVAGVAVTVAVRKPSSRPEFREPLPSSGSADSQMQTYTCRLQMPGQIAIAEGPAYRSLADAIEGAKRNEFNEAIPCIQGTVQVKAGAVGVGNKNPAQRLENSAYQRALGAGAD